MKRYLFLLLFTVFFTFVVYSQPAGFWVMAICEGIENMHGKRVASLVYAGLVGSLDYVEINPHRNPSKPEKDTIEKYTFTILDMVLMLIKQGNDNSTIIDIIAGTYLDRKLMRESFLVFWNR